MSLIGKPPGVFAMQSMKLGWAVWATRTDPEDLVSYNRVGFAKTRSGAAGIVTRLRGRKVTGWIKIHTVGSHGQPWKVGSRGFGGVAYEIPGEPGKPSFRIEQGTWDTRYPTQRIIP